MIRRKMRLMAVAGLALMLTFMLVGGAVAAKAGGGEPARLIVIFDGPAVNQAAEDYVEDKGGQVLYTFDIVLGMVVLLPGGEIGGLRGISGVREVGLDGRIYAIDAELDNSWGVQHIGAGSVHGYNEGTGIKLAIIDSGVDYNHSDLNANYAGGYDFVNDDADPLDDNGHGTHMAGIAAAENDDAGVVGVAPGAAIYALKVLDASGGGYWSDIIRALEWSVNNKIQVANMSFGAGRDAPGVRDAFKAAYNAGIVLVAAAGNSGNPKGKGNSIIYPARYEEVIAVGATDQTDTRASFSSTGDQLELVAPGVEIYSTILNGDYASYNGTSMASPHVAGTAALIIASGIADANGNGYINDDVRLRLQQTADDLGDDGKDSQYGYGLVDAFEAAPPPVGNRVPVANAGPDQSVKTGSTVQLNGTGSYDPDGDTITYSWTFISTPLGSNATLSSATTATPTFGADVDGTYEVELTVSDGELSAFDRVVITAATVTEPTTVSVASITYNTNGGKDNDRHLLITVALVDDLPSPIADASVSIDVYLDGSLYGSGTGTTGTDGTVTFKANNAPSGTYTTTVTDVTAAGLTWDGDTPPNEFIKE